MGGGIRRNFSRCREKSGNMGNGRPLLCPISEQARRFRFLMIRISQSHSYSTAVGLFNTAVNLILLFVVNTIASKTSEVNFV